MEPPQQRKRKAINEFFTPVAKHKAPKPPKTREQGSGNKATDAITVLKTLVPGLSIHHDFVNHTEEQNILNFLNDPSKCIWRTDLSRRTMHFGGTYCLMPSKLDGQSHAKPQILQAPPMPEEFDWLIQRMIDTRIYPDSQRPQYCIVNEYTGNLGISAHTESFRFGEPVVGLSLLSACPIRFHELTKAYDGSVRSGKAGKASKTGRAVDVVMPGRSLLVMKGESRWEWQHEIMRSARGRGVGWKRISLTFRYELNGKI
ncbi:hypothetical protein N7G274_008434 [Stereocaulon virgatum]|uniref:Fe2OG dioxygenase domain-containing protein n=1 Tax=Stereocaulon virgatum TaxID=373712 RepID=A0ABR4A149_9LECA